MSMIDLAAEMTVAGRSVRQIHLDHLRVLGVSRASIAEAGKTFWPFGVTQAEPAGNGLYQPGGGQQHLVVPVIEDGVLVDIAAFRSTAPSDWLLRTGNGWCLGLERGLDWWTWYAPADPLAVPPRHETGSPVHVFSNPLDWLQGARAGLCVVDWDAAEIARLDVLQRVTVTDERTAQLLTAALTRPVQLPSIAIQEVAYAA